MFVARRKLVGLFSVLIAFVIVMTINHYFYLDDSNGNGSNNSQKDDGRQTHAQRLQQQQQQRQRQQRLLRKQHVDLDAGHHQIQEPLIDATEHGVGGQAKRAGLVSGGDGGEENYEGSNNRVPKDVDDDDDEDDEGAMTSDGSHYIPKRRVVHLDLKGAPPKISYFKSVFPTMRAAGATHLLVEYEDMFPHWGPLRNLSARNAYTKQDVQTLLELAKASQLEVIPLVQTLGHLEYALKLEEFRHLREVPEHPQAMCPSRDKGWDLVSQIIDQVASLHPDARWMHVGLDEVFQLAQCPLCSERITRANNDPESRSYHDGKTLFLQHVHRVGDYVRRRKGLRPIIWDDILRTIPAPALQESGIGPLVEVMVWVYIEDIDRFVDPMTWSAYGEVFRHVWAASAFKGAFGERLYMANIQRHVGNNLAWLEVMRRESQGSTRIRFRGVVLTGWSRYDHFAVLCELLPPAFPSLILNLAILTEGAHSFEAARKANKLLQCGAQKALMTSEELLRNPVQWDLHRCRFPGSDLFNLLSSYDMNHKEISSLHDRLTEKNGWMTDYNVRHRFTSTQRVVDLMRSASFLPNALRSLEAQLREALGRHYDRYTVEEWLEQHTLPLSQKLQTLQDRADVLTRETVWPRRPLGPPGAEDAEDATAAATATAKTLERVIEVEEEGNGLLN